MIINPLIELYQLDCSLYQEQAVYGRFIDWFKLKADQQYKFQGVWIKIAEGAGTGNYPLVDAKRQVDGAKLASFRAINGYHFYYFQWFSTVANRWYQINATEEAQTFADAWLACGVPGLHPMSDCEDPFVGKFLTWTDTVSANAAIAFARRLNAHLKKYHEEIAHLIGKKPDIYSGAWWWDRWGTLILQYYPDEALWWKDYKYILADYVGGLDLPAGFTPDMVIAWQKTSTPPHPVDGIPTGHVVPGDALDVDQWMGTEEQFEEWCGEEVNTMAGTYVQTTPQESRASLVVLSDEDTVDISQVAAGCDAVILKMLAMVETHLVADTQFKQRVGLAGTALGLLSLDASYLVEWSLGVVESEPWYDSKFLKALLNQWRLVPISEADWSAHILNLRANDGKWAPLRGLVLYLWNTATPLWQLATLKYALKYLTIFMADGHLPKVPVFVLADAAFFRTNDIDAIWQNGLLGMLQNQSIAGVGILEVGKPGLFTEVPLATPLASVGDIFQFRPSNTYKYSFVPYGFETDVWFDIYSWNRFKVAGIPAPLMVGCWCDTVEEMKEFLGVTNPPPPPVSDLESRVKSLEDLRDAIKALFLK